MNRGKDGSTFLPRVFRQLQSIIRLQKTEAFSQYSVFVSCRIELRVIPANAAGGIVWRGEVGVKKENGMDLYITRNLVWICTARLEFKIVQRYHAHSYVLRASALFLQRKKYHT